VQEYKATAQISNPSFEILTAEYLRGNGMGGGVGGMTYSIRKKGSVRLNHYFEF